jgi:hypothetical protein
LRLVATQLRYDSATDQLHAWVAIRNDGREQVPGPSSVAVSDFVPSDVRPTNAVCTDPTSPRPALFCAFDHRDTYGDDGVLAPGEASEAVEWILAGTGGESFAFRARLIFAPSVEGTISGVVFDDRNTNGRRDDGEPGVAGVGIGLEHADADFVRIRKTDEQGRFAFDVDEPGLYSLTKTVPTGWRATTPTEMEVFIVRRPDGSLSRFDRADFGCVRMSTDVGIQGTVFMDHDRDGVRDGNEPGIGSVGVMVTSMACEEGGVFIARSDSDGRYSIGAGSLQGCGMPWLVRRLPEFGLVGTTPGQFFLARRSPEPGVGTIDFGLAPPESTQAYVTVEGRVFADLNENGEYDPSDRPLRGAQVQLVSPCDLLRASYTDAEGIYRFEPLEIGYCPVTGVWQSVPQFPIHTTPNPVDLQIPDTPGFHLIRVDFGIGMRDGSGEP